MPIEKPIFTFLNRRFEVTFSDQLSCLDCVLGPADLGTADAFVCANTPCRGSPEGTDPFVLTAEIPTQ